MYDHQQKDQADDFFCDNKPLSLISRARLPAVIASDLANSRISSSKSVLVSSAEFIGTRLIERSRFRGENKEITFCIGYSPATVFH